MSELENLNEIITEFVNEAVEIVEDLSEKLLELEKDKNNKDLVNEIFRHMHTLKGSSGFLGFTDLGIVAHKAEDILNKFRKGEASITSGSIDVLLEALDIISKQVKQLKEGQQLSVPYQAVVDRLIEVYNSLGNAEIAAESKEKTFELTGDTIIKNMRSLESSDEEFAEATDEDIFEGEMKEIIDDFIVETTDILDKIDNGFVSLEENPEDLVLLNEIFRFVHTIKGTGSFLGFHQLTSVTHVAEDLLNLLRKGDIVVNDLIMDVLLEFVDILKTLLADIGMKKIVERDINKVVERLKSVINSNNKDAVAIENKFSLKDPLKDIKIPQQKAKEAAPETVPVIEEKNLKTPVAAAKSDDDDDDEEKEQTDKAALARDNSSKKIADQTIRVDVQRLESLLNLVGELVLGRNQLQQVTNLLMTNFSDSPYLDELNRVNGNIAQITSSIQDGVMKTRMVAIGKVFNKFPRLIRDLSRQTNKNVELIINGAETELDKTLVEEINDPLVHLIRNSVDHGIESPEERTSMGKPPKGKVVLFAAQEGDNIVIGVEDDGKGLDVERIKKKAVERGLATETEIERMTQREIFNFIFMPGFSTAEKVTNVSGRGVGMDVVKTNISKLNGHIDIDSTVGQGTSILIKLPLTLAIIKGLLVNVRNEIFVIPISSVREINSIEDGQLQTVNKMEVFKLRNEVIPLIRFTDIFDLPPAPENSTTKKDRFVVVVALAEKRYGFIVDSVKEGQAEIVIKKLGEYMPHIRGIAGGTIMGDGRVRLIVDVQEIILLTTAMRSGKVVSKSN